MLVRELRRLLESLPPNQEIYIDSPSEEHLLPITGKWYKNTDHNGDPIVALRVSNE